jgi:steroid delta-isomerase-like uncharacterized protein
MTVAHEFAEAFNGRDVDGLVGCFTGDASYHDLFYGHFQGHDGLRKLFDRVFAEGRDHLWSIDAVAEAADFVMAEWTFGFVVGDAVPRSAGRSLRFRGVSVFELADGRCHTYREYYDRGPILVELGFQPDSLWKTLARQASA